MLRLDNKILDGRLNLITFAMKLLHSDVISAEVPKAQWTLLERLAIDDTEAAAGSSKQPSAGGALSSKSAVDVLADTNERWFHLMIRLSIEATPPAYVVDPNLLVSNKEKFVV